MGLTEHLADHLQIPRVQLPHPPNITRQAAGFFLSLTQMPSLMVLMGDLMLADRASDGVISVSFQRDSSDLRDGGLTALPDLKNRQLKNRAAQQSRGTNPPPAAVLQSV